jgi:hypothetical protein
VAFPGHQNREAGHPDAADSQEMDALHAHRCGMVAFIVHYMIPQRPEQRKETKDCLMRRRLAEPPFRYPVNPLSR